MLKCSNAQVSNATQHNTTTHHTIYIGLPVPRQARGVLQEVPHHPAGPDQERDAATAVEAVEGVPIFGGVAKVAQGPAANARAGRALSNPVWVRATKTNENTNTNTAYQYDIYANTNTNTHTNTNANTNANANANTNANANATARANANANANAAYECGMHTCGGDDETTNLMWMANKSTSKRHN